MGPAASIVTTFYYLGNFTENTQMPPVILAVFVEIPVIFIDTVEL